MFKLHKKISVLGLLMLSLTSLLLSFGTSEAKANNPQGKAQLLLIFTTDIHGQLNSTDYETGGTLSAGGLARAYGVIQQARSENSNYLTFDLGDVLFDYTTEYFYSNYHKTIQPIYQAMGMVGYDAVTLGNHEFDYEYEYVVNQLKDSGMFDKVVVSNLTDSMTGDHPFKENMIITKTLATDNGGTMEVKVGVIGETLPILSAKGQNFAGVLAAQDIVEYVRQQAKKLKEQGADLIVVLSHSGMGSEKPEYGDKNASYALTKIDEVDVVLCGHEHNMFPSTDKTGAYYKLSGVDKSTNLVNEKNLIMAEDRGESVGIVDLELSKESGEIVIENRKSEVRKASGKKAPEDAAISALYDDYKDEMLEYTREVIGTVDKDYPIENYNGMVEDNSAVQLLNDAKRAYAINYIYNTDRTYEGYPVIATSTYVSYGANGTDDYVNITGDVTESKLASLQGYNGYTALYKITGRQLREWLEWSASAYRQTQKQIAWNGNSMGSFVSTAGAESLVTGEWLDSWNTFYVFDGVEYTINPMIPARYNHAGVKVNSTYRITELTCNGQPVKDDQVFVLASGRLSKVTEANANIDEQWIVKGYIRTQGVLRDYIQQKAKSGTLKIKPDYNWKIELPGKTKFVTKTSTQGEAALKKSTWFIDEVGRQDGYIYSVGSFEKRPDKNEVKILTSVTYSDATSDKVRVAVEASSRYGIKEIRYTVGELDKNAGAWNATDLVKNGYFYVTSNETYTVYAVDNKGNANVECVTVDNISKGMLKKPSVKSYTNRKTKIEGSAEPGCTIEIKTSAKTYTTVVDTNGRFVYALPSQKSGTKLTLKAVNKAKNLTSEEVVVTVKRTGPNRPQVEGIFNNLDQVRGKLNDTDANVFAIIEDQVYVGNEKTAELFKKCTTFQKPDIQYTVNVTDVRVDSENVYQLTVPVQKIGTSISIYTVDHISRSSMANTVKVQDAAPNPPVVYDLTCADNRIEGVVTSSKANTVFTVYVSVNDENFVVKSDKTGYFFVDVDPSMLKAGTEVRVMAKDTVKNINRSSYTTLVIVKEPDEFISEMTELSLGGLESGQTSISGYYDDDEVTIAVKSQGRYHIYKAIPDAEGEFTVELDAPLRGGDIVYGHTTAPNGSIMDMVREEVELEVPCTPVVEEEITNGTKQFIVYTDVEAVVVASIGTKEYESSDCHFNEAEQMYEYVVRIPQTAAGKTVKLYAYNQAGTSKTLSKKVSKLVPDAPTVNKVYTTTKTIKGKISDFDYYDETEVYAKIGSKTYSGTVKEDGSFSIKIKAQKKNTKITVWAVNEEGRGLMTSVKAVEKPKKK